MKAYIRTVNGLVNMDDVQAISWKSRKEVPEDDPFPISLIFFMKGGTTFLANASIKSLYKTQERFKEMWTQEYEVLDISEGDEE